MTSSESQLEDWLIAKLRDLKYAHRSDIRDRAALELNFRDKFNSLNHVRLTDGEFQLGFNADEQFLPIYQHGIV